VAPVNASGAQRKEHRGPDWEKLHELERRYDRESRLIAMVEALGLDQNQADLVAAAMEQTDYSDRKAARDAARTSGLSPDKSADTAIKDALHETIAAVLTPEQQAAYTEFRAAEARDRQEIHASRMLGEMQRWLHLSDDQKDQLYTVFAGQAAESGSDPGPWVWSKTFEQPGQAQKFQAILKPEQYRLMEERIVTMSNYFRPPPPPSAPAPKPSSAK
jgi:hypothetical protein